jgi:hypothetical protein
MRNKSLDSGFQLEILELLNETPYQPIDQDQIPTHFKEDPWRWYTNLRYLKDHGLVDMTEAGEMTMDAPEVMDVTITTKGVDFLEPDGGLTAALGTMTIRLDDEQVKIFLMDNVNKSPLSDEKKSRLRGVVKNLSSAALSELAKQSVGLLFRQGPDLLQLLQSMAH